MKILEITEGKREYLDLLLLGDEDVKMIDRYLDRGRLFVLNDGGAVAICAVTDEGNGVLEIKNLAVREAYQRRGYGRAIIEYIVNMAKGEYREIQVGTGESPFTLPFYERCGFSRSHRIKNFFLDNYDHEIYEGGILLTDMVYLRREI